MPTLRVRAVLIFVSLSSACGHDQITDVVEELPPIDVPCTNCGDVVVNDGGDVAPADTPTPIDAADVSPTDGPPPDAAMDAMSPDVVTDGPVDVRTDAGPTGPCTTVLGPDRIVNEPRVIPRLVYVRADGAGYLSGAFAQIAGLDNAYLLRVGTDGMSGTLVNVSSLVGPLVRGGDFAVNGTGHLDAYASNASGSLDIYVRAVDATDTPTGGAIHVESSPNTSQDPQIEATASGWVVVWLERPPGSNVLMSASISSPGLTVGAPVTLTPGTNVGAFDLVSDSGRLVLAYVAQNTSTTTAMVQPLTPTGAPLGTATALTMTGTTMIDSLGAALRGTDLVVVTGLSPMGTLAAQRIDVTTGTMSTPMTLSALGTNNSKPGIALDGTSGFVIAYRAVYGGAPTIEMARLDSTLGPRENGSIVMNPAGAGDSVRIATRNDGTYALAWADLSATATNALVRVMRCP